MTLTETLLIQATANRLTAQHCDKAADELLANTILLRQAADKIAELEAELARRDEADGLRPLADIKDSIASERGDQLRDKQVDQ